MPIFIVLCSASQISLNIWFSFPSFFIVSPAARTSPPNHGRNPYKVIKFIHFASCNSTDCLSSIYIFFFPSSFTLVNCDIHSRAYRATGNYAHIIPSIRSPFIRWFTVKFPDLILGCRCFNLWNSHGAIFVPAWKPPKFNPQIRHTYTHQQRFERHRRWESSIIFAVLLFLFSSSLVRSKVCSTFSFEYQNEFARK